MQARLYAGLELGVCLKNLMFGVASGRGNLDFSATGDSETVVRSQGLCLLIGAVELAVAGCGTILGTNHSLVEYGVGAAYSVNKWDFSLTVSNWDRVVYYDPGSDVWCVVRWVSGEGEAAIPASGSFPCT